MIMIVMAALMKAVTALTEQARTVQPPMVALGHRLVATVRGVFAILIYTIVILTAMEPRSVIV